jgi:hypothetical protein
MSEKPLRIRIALATENFVAVDRELIEKIPWHAVVPPVRDEGGFSSLAVFSTNAGNPALNASSFPG